LSTFPSSDFELSKEGVITKYTGGGGNIVIPAAMWGDPVKAIKAIGTGAFEKKGITSITIPNSVTSIGDGAFYGCRSLTSVTIPSNVTSIGNIAFEGCTSLASITVNAANTVFSSENGVLFNKAKTTILFYPEGHSGTSYVIPSSVASIGDGAFYGCRSLTSVTIPGSVTTIGKSAFWSCTGLASVTMQNGVTTIGGHAFYYCRSLTSVTIPGSVTTIGESAFNHCRSLTSVTIPGSVTTIGGSAFSDCTSLASVIFETGSNIASGNFGNNAFPGVDNLKTLYLAQAADAKAGTYRRASTSATTWTKD
jgi:hypothetical protein